MGAVIAPYCSLSSLTELEATDIVSLKQYLQKPESSLAVQLQAGKNAPSAFLYALVPTVPSLAMHLWEEKSNCYSAHLNDYEG